MTATAALMMSLLMLAGFSLAAGGIYTLARLNNRTRGVLMLVAAVVMWGNVAVMTL